MLRGHRLRTGALGRPHTGQHGAAQHPQQHRSEQHPPARRPGSATSQCEQRSLRFSGQQVGGGRVRRGRIYCIHSIHLTFQAVCRGYSKSCPSAPTHPPMHPLLIFLETKVGSAPGSARTGSSRPRGAAGRARAGAAAGGRGAAVRGGRRPKSVLAKRSGRSFFLLFFLIVGRGAGPSPPPGAITPAATCRTRGAAPAVRAPAAAHKSGAGERQGRWRNAARGRGVRGRRTASLSAAKSSATRSCIASHDISSSLLPPPPLRCCRAWRRRISAPHRSAAYRGARP
eukprot:SAG31_NODE_62_length_28678_cov_21.548270_1_plen_285_part_00